MKVFSNVVFSDRLQLLGSSLIAQGLRLLTTIVMARLVTPRDYGLVALVSSVPGLISTFGDFGAARSLVQIRDIEEQQVKHTAFVITGTLASLYAGIAIITGLLLSVHYRDPRLASVGAIQGATGILASLYSYQLACLSRQLQFRREAYQNVVFGAVQAASGMTLALAGLGLFALVIQSLLAQLVANAILLRRFPLEWPSHCNANAVRRFWQLGWRITLSQYINNIQVNIMSIFMGFGFGPAMLGQFGRASQIRDLVGYNISTAFDRLLFPLFSAAQSDAARIRSILRRGYIYTTAVSALGGVLFCANGNTIVRVLLGPRWDVAAGLLRILAVGLIFSGLSLPSIVAALAIGKPTIWMYSAVLGLLLLIPAMGFGLFYGIEGLCWGLVCAQITVSLTQWWWTTKEVALSYSRTIIDLLPIWAAAATAFATMMIINQLLQGSIVVQFAMSCIAGTSIFIAIAWFGTSRDLRPVLWTLQSGAL